MNTEMKVKDIETVPAYKKETVKNIAGKIKKYRTVLIASIKGLPASQFQLIKKSLRGKAEVVLAKKTLIMRGVQESQDGGIQNLKGKITSDVVLLFSDVEAFELAGILLDSQSSTKAKTGDISPEDIEIEAGPTDLVPGPAISELSSVGLKVSVEGGKLAIKQGAVVVKKGEAINEKVAGVLSKLKVFPMKVGYVPVAAYDSKSHVIYEDIKIDKKGVYEELKTSISKALGFAIKMSYITKETISYFISKAAMEEKALSKLVEVKNE